jgi:hypothetical protein
MDSKREEEFVKSSYPELDYRLQLLVRLLPNEY